MSDYDFAELNDKEFEILCTDLIGDERGHRFERFKPGKDGGVDGRYFAEDRKEVVLQCKHWPGTPIEQLLSTLEKKETQKVSKLKPQSYILAISKQLSRLDKQALRKAFGPFIKREDDIYGREDLNQLLSTRPHVLKRHTKLWLKNAEVLTSILNYAILGRSLYAVEAMLAAARTYVRTNSHLAAVQIAEANGVVILSGEPGIGKTTLAEQLCLEYIASGFTLYKIADDVSGAEAVFRADDKQIFYFDDFLGRNYLEAFRGTTGSQIVNFINRVSKAKSNKRFILTSRSTILNRGKFVMDYYRHENIENNEYILTIKSLTQMDRARILYNHIWFSVLPPEYVEEIYKHKRYRDIVGHANYNPRLIQFITNHDRLKECAPDKYWGCIEQHLDNPAEVWENPFSWQLEPNGRILVLLVATHGREISEESLGMAFARFASSAATQHLMGGLDFLGTVKQLTGSFISRRIRDGGTPLIDLFNPSIGDYVLRRFASDATALFFAIKSLRSLPPLKTLQSQVRDEVISKHSYSSITNDLLADMCEGAFKGFTVDYIAEIIILNIPFVEIDHKRKRLVKTAIQALVLDDLPSDCSTISYVYQWSIGQNIVSENAIFDFIVAASKTNRDEEEVRSLANLLGDLDQADPQWTDAHDALRDCAVEWMADSLPYYVGDNDILASVGFEEYLSAERAVESAVEEKLKEFSALQFTNADVESATSKFDAREALDDRYTGSATQESYSFSNVGNSLERFDDIDDLFERG